MGTSRSHCALYCDKGHDERQLVEEKGSLVFMSQSPSVKRSQGRNSRRQDPGAGTEAEAARNDAHLSARLPRGGTTHSGLDSPESSINQEPHAPQTRLQGHLMEVFSQLRFLLPR